MRALFIAVGVLVLASPGIAEISHGAYTTGSYLAVETGALWVGGAFVGEMTAGQCEYHMGGLPLLLQGGSGYLTVPESDTGNLPGKARIETLYPNPFNPTLTVVFNLPEPGDVKVLVYNSLGQMVRRVWDGPMTEGRHSILFDGTHLASGTYFIRATMPEGHVVMRKVVLVK